VTSSFSRWTIESSALLHAYTALCSYSATAKPPSQGRNKLNKGLLIEGMRETLPRAGYPAA